MAHPAITHPTEHAYSDLIPPPLCRHASSSRPSPPQRSSRPTDPLLPVRDGTCPASSDRSSLIISALRRQVDALLLLSNHTSAHHCRQHTSDRRPSSLAEPSPTDQSPPTQNGTLTDKPIPARSPRAHPARSNSDSPALGVPRQLSPTSRT